MSAFLKFLQRNSVSPSERLPLVHTTRAYHLRRIWDTNSIVATPCDVFTKENLNYFFVGRPSYKAQTEDQEAEFWELPVCFIVEFSAVTSIKRIFPFDSGAFRKGKFPGYISIMPIEEFEVSAEPEAPQKIIGAFFGSTQRYFRLQSKEHSQFAAEFSLGPFDAEIHALHKLAMHKHSGAFDDRRLAIEIQSEMDVPLLGNNLLAVICPTVYLDDSKFRTHVETVWNAEILSCEIYPLNYQSYMSQVYSKVEDLFKRKGLMT